MLNLLISFFLSVLAGVAANCISKWFDRKDQNSNGPKNE